MKRSLSALLLLLFVAFTVAQAPPAVQQTTNAENAADELAKSINQELKGLVATGNKQVPLASHSYHIVFLFDSSQVNEKTVYRDFVSDVIRRFLERMLANQERRKVAPDEANQVSIYPYQLDLYARSGHGVGPLPLTKENIVKIVNGLPRRAIVVRGDGKTPYKLTDGLRNPDGHDNTEPRKELFELLNRENPMDPGDSRPEIVVQFTPNQDNVAPNDPELGRRIGTRDASLWGVSEAGYTRVAFVNARTDSPLTGRPPYPVRIWAYAPKVIQPAISFPAVGGSEPEPTSEEKKGNGLPGWLIPAILLVAGAIGAIWFLTSTITVIIGSERTRKPLRRFGQIKLVAHEQGKNAGIVYVVPGVPNTVTAGTVLGVIEYGATGAQLRGSSWTPGKAGAKGLAVDLARGPAGNDVWLSGKSGERTPTFKVTVQ